MAWEGEEEIRGILGKRRWSEEEGRLVVSAYQASGKTLSSFAREYGLQPSRMWRWSARVRGERKGGMRFHPVRLREAEPLDPKAGPIEVVLVKAAGCACRKASWPRTWCACWRLWKGGYHADAALLGPDLYGGGTGRPAPRL